MTNWERVCFLVRDLEDDIESGFLFHNIHNNIEVVRAKLPVRDLVAMLPEDVQSILDCMFPDVKGTNPLTKDSFFDLIHILQSLCQNHKDDKKNMNGGIEEYHIDHRIDLDYAFKMLCALKNFICNNEDLLKFKINNKNECFDLALTHLLWVLLRECAMASGLDIDTVKKQKISVTVRELEALILSWVRKGKFEFILYGKDIPPIVDKENFGDVISCTLADYILILEYNYDK